MIPACVAIQYLFALEVTAVGHHGERVDAHGRARLFGHRRQLVAIDTLGDDFVRHDQMVLGIDRGLHVVADDATVAALHRARIRVGQRQLLIGAGEHLRFEHLELLHLLLQGRNLLLQPALLQLCRFRLGPVGRVHRRQVTRDALFDLRHPPLHLGRGEVLVAVVHRLELAAVDGDDRLA